jgi:hypothetical protein
MISICDSTAKFDCGPDGAGTSTVGLIRVDGVASIRRLGVGTVGEVGPAGLRVEPDPLPQK